MQRSKMMSGSGLFVLIGAVGDPVSGAAVGQPLLSLNFQKTYQSLPSLTTSAASSPRRRCAARVCWWGASSHHL
jgi:hypothetical protein